MEASNKEQAALQHLLVWLQDEVLGQGARLNTLQGLRASMAKRDPSECESILQQVHEQEEVTRRSETKVKAIFEALGLIWGISPSALSLRSIAERAGDEGERILELRTKLELLLEAVSTESKQVSATARTHRSVILDVLGVLFENASGDPLDEQGALLDAEA